MDKRAMKEPVASTPAWDELEEWTRGRTQEWMQKLLVEDVTEFLDRAKSHHQEAAASSVYTPIDRTSCPMLVYER